MLAFPAKLGICFKEKSFWFTLLQTINEIGTGGIPILKENC